MKTIETIATVSKDGKITAQLPLDIPEGEHQVVIVIDEKPLTEEEKNKQKKAPLKFSAYSVGLVSESVTFRREDLYAND
ncbi:MAG: hypothetical protein FWK04_06045 [Nostoc sp. GBBB01]|jgi:hypothetical protein|uniref:Uncharacterized protein n=1 Tax=Nostoc punctiforme FACHB-252 TaxID=1357509 RepID=A0ABR8H8U2_NOSPU|nr:hypothetical protein [Nostoc punctiforme]MBD2612183.1 hypothetical protein [Nostoc punctiforme FACHB-252]MBL1198638.1 hypothetical protein [Nostoc sp. GBBB01]